MNKKEVLRIIETIEEFYNNPWTRNKSDKEEALANAANTWYRMLKDYEYGFISENLKNYILNNKFAPTVADLVKLPKIESDRYVPTVEETYAYLVSQEKARQEALNDPKTKEARAKAREEIRKILGIRG